MQAESLRQPVWARAWSRRVACSTTVRWSAARSPDSGCRLKVGLQQRVGLGARLGPARVRDRQRRVRQQPSHRILLACPPARS